MAIIDKMEAQLRPPTIGLKPYEAKVIPLTSGEDMLVREATWDEIPLLMETIEPLMKQPKDFYDIVASRIYAELLGMSYHTITLKRGARVGAHLFAAKMEYHLDVMDQDEVWIVAESPNGFKRWMIEYELESRPECPHELGGVPTYVLTKQLWEKHKGAKCTGIRPAFEDVIEANKILRKPAKISV